MKKILFIIPRYSIFGEYSENIISTAPYGILSLISYISKNSKYDIRIIDFNHHNINFNIYYFKPDYVCISALFDSNFTHIKYIVPVIKKLYPKCILLVGGGFATHMYKLLLKEVPYIDAVCYGEGELPLKKLLEGKFSPAWITNESLRNNIVPKHDFIEDLDEIPVINFDYIDIKKYNNRSPTLIDTFNDIEKDKVEMNIHTSRGCPFNCIFCSNSKIHGKKIRYMSIERIIETIKYYINNYNMNVLLIEDDNFLFDKNRALEVLDMIKEFNIKVEFPNGVAVNRIDDDIAKSLYEANVDVVPLAIESGSNHTLRIMKKPLRKEQIYKTVKSLRKFNIRIHAFIIIGIPNELDEHRKETYDMLLKLGIDWVYFFIALPIAGTELYKICEENGYLINNSYDDYNVTKCNIKAPGVDPDNIEREFLYMTMVVNYIANYNYRNEKYEVCLPYFLNAVKKYPNNVIAQYMLYNTLKKMNKNESKN